MAMNFDIAPQSGPGSERARTKPRSERRPKTNASAADMPQSDRQEYSLAEVKPQRRPDTAHQAERVQYNEQIAVEADRRNQEARDRQTYGAYYDHLPQVETNSQLLTQKTSGELQKLRNLGDGKYSTLQALKDVRANLLNLRDEIEAQQAYINQMPPGSRTLEVKDKNYSLTLSIENALLEVEEKSRGAEGAARVQKVWSLDTHPVDTKPKVVPDQSASKWIESPGSKVQTPKPSTWGKFKAWWNGK